jgi:hypothetical protein
MTAGQLFKGAASLLIVLVGAYSAKITVDYDRTADFSLFQTYAWARGAQAANPLIDRRIIEAIDSRLGASGLQRVDGSGDPDLVVVYYTAADTLIQVDTTKLGGWGSGWSWNSGLAGASAVQIEQIAPGELAVDIARVKDKKFIWHGLATSSVSDSPTKTWKTVNNALDKMFQRFPPSFKKQASGR